MRLKTLSCWFADINSDLLLHIHYKTIRKNVSVNRLNDVTVKLKLRVTHFVIMLRIYLSILELHKLYGWSVWNSNLVVLQSVQQLLVLSQNETNTIEKNQWNTTKEDATEDSTMEQRTITVLLSLLSLHAVKIHWIIGCIFGSLFLKVDHNNFDLLCQTLKLCGFYKQSTSKHILLKFPLVLSPNQNKRQKTHSQLKRTSKLIEVKLTLVNLLDMKLEILKYIT